jgi:hypothetical protein
MIFRSDTDKSDLARSCHRPDRPFFASGACHILAYAFLQKHSDFDYHPIYISPHPGFRGSHLVVSDGNTIFDYHGYSDHDYFMEHYFIKMRRYFPGWQADLIQIEDSLIDSGFCSRFNHRMPFQYFQNPIPRAFSYLSRFPAPEKQKDRTRWSSQPLTASRLLLPLRYGRSRAAASGG